MYCKKGKIEWWCQGLGGPHTVKPIFTSQPTDWSNYSLLLGLTEEITSTWRQRGGFSAVPFAFNQRILCPYLVLHATCPDVTRSLLEGLSTDIACTVCDTPGPVSICGSISICADVDVCSCDWVLVRLDVIWEKLWQLHYLGGFSLSACTLPFFAPTRPIKHLFAVLTNTVKALLPLSVSWAYCTVLLTHQL